MKAPFLTILLLAIHTSAGAAQAVDGGGAVPANDSASARPACEDGAISHVFVDNHSVFDTTDPELDERFAWAYRVANALHIRTRASVVRRELLFAPGDCLDPERLEESERLLRGLGFLSRVDIFAVRQPDSTYHVVVDTQDEWSTQVDVRARWEDGLHFEGVRLEETNLLGTGQSVGLFYFERNATRDYGVRYQTAQLGGTRWDLEVAGGRTRSGTFLSHTLAYPFVGERGRWAARQSFERRDRFFDYVVDGSRSGETHLLVPLRATSADLAAMTRLGRPGRLTLLGGGLSHHEIAYPAGPDGVRMVHGDDYDDRDTASTAVADPVLGVLEPIRTTRLFLLLGQRRIRWVQRRGLDSMRGEEDVRLGTEASLAVGRSLPGLGNTAEDVFATLTGYGGVELGRVLLATRLRADGRRMLGAATDRRWGDLMVEGEVLGYWRPRRLPRHTLFLRAAGVGGWNVRTPFQLTLGGDRGVRGYASERFPGARRLLFSVEDRIYFGWPFRDVLDLGGTLFLDVGRIWPGDVPFGVDSGWRGTAGVGLRGSFPAGSHTTYRLDLAVPLDRPVDWRGVRLVLSVGEIRGLAAGFGSVQLDRSRTGGVTGTLFHFPN